MRDWICVFVFRRQIQKVALHHQRGGAGDEGGGGAAGAVSQVISSPEAPPPHPSLNTPNKPVMLWLKPRPLDLLRTLPQCGEWWRWGGVRGWRGRRREEEEEVWQLLLDLWWQPILVCYWWIGEWAGQTQQPIIWLTQLGEYYEETHTHTHSFYLIKLELVFVL